MEPKKYEAVPLSPSSSTACSFDSVAVHVEYWSFPAFRKSEPRECRNGRSDHLYNTALLTTRLQYNNIKIRLRKYICLRYADTNYSEMVLPPSQRLDCRKYQRSSLAKGSEERVGWDVTCRPRASPSRCGSYYGQSHD